MNHEDNWCHHIRSERTDIGSIEYHYLTYSGEGADSYLPMQNTGSVIEIRNDHSNGTILRIEENNKIYTVWIPSKALSVVFDKTDRIAAKSWIDCHANWILFPTVTIEISGEKDQSQTVCIAYVKIDDPEAIVFKELQTRSEIESRRYLKSDWFNASTPSDFWKYYINGSVYDPRTDPRADKRFKSQQCALAWWDYFGMLSGGTGKVIYSLLQNEIARSVADDFERQGAWRHGYWSDSMEIHSRFYLDGVNLLISQYEKCKDRYWLEKAKSAMDFYIDELTDSFENGSIWFLHDSIEGERKHSVKSDIFGKSPENSLCINTHVQALCVLQRLMEIDGAEKYQDYYKSGKQALLQVLEHQPAEFYYKLLDKYVLMSENRKATANSAIRKGIISSQRLVLNRYYWNLMKKYNRLVYPSGFIERDLSFTQMSKRYHILNVKDLLMLYEGDQDEKILPYIKNGVEFIEKEFKSKSISKHLIESPFFLEYLDVLGLYSKLIDKTLSHKINEYEKTMIDTLGGVSLDYYANIRDYEI